MRYVTLTLAVAGWFAVGSSATFVRGDDPTPGARSGQKDGKIEPDVGDPAPAFEATDHAGRTWRSADHVGRKWVVVYFYPGDFTPGCTRQAEAFRENANALAERGVEVVGVSGDAVAIHERFKKAHGLNFTLLSDEPGEVAAKFGVPAQRRPVTVRPTGPDRRPLLDDEGRPWTFGRSSTFRRWTFVIAPDGTVAYRNTHVRPEEDGRRVLEVIDGRTAPEQ